MTLRDVHGNEIAETIRLDGDRVLDTRDGVFVGFLAVRERDAMLGGPTAERVLHNGVYQAWIGWTERDALDALNRIAALAHEWGTSVQSLVLGERCQCCRRVEVTSNGDIVEPPQGRGVREPA